MEQTLRRGAIIVCGGQSTRMGRDKATLPFGPECLLQRVVRLVGEVVPSQNIVIVAAREQPLPQLSSEIRIARDEHQNRGPLEGLAAGFRGLGTDVDAAYATSCDVPLLVPAFVSRMFELLGNHEIAVPHDGERFHPLAAVYRPTVLTHIVKLLAADQLRLRYLFEEAPTKKVPVDDLRSVDPSLSTLENLNAPDDYLKVLAAAGFPQPNEMAQEDGLP